MILRFERKTKICSILSAIIIMILACVNLNTEVIYASNNIVISIQPKDFVGKAGDAFSATIEASGTGLKYQWQISYDGGKTWKDSRFDNAKTARYSFTVGTGDIGMNYRCIVTDQYGNSVTSEKACITGGVKIISQPKNFVGKAGDAFSATIEASGTGLKYQWQISYDGGKTWKNSRFDNAKTARYSFTVGTGDIGMNYRCIVTDQYGVSIVSEECRIIESSKEDWELPIM